MGIEIVGNAEDGFWSYLKTLPQNLKLLFVALAISSVVSLSVAGYSIVSASRQNVEQQDEIDLLIDSISDLESELSIKSNEIKWLQTDLDEQTGRINSLCDVLGQFVWC